MYKVYTLSIAWVYSNKGEKGSEKRNCARLVWREYIVESRATSEFDRNTLLSPCAPYLLFILSLSLSVSFTVPMCLHPFNQSPINWENVHLSVYNVWLHSIVPSQQQVWTCLLTISSGLLLYMVFMWMPSDKTLKTTPVIYPIPTGHANQHYPSLLSRSFIGFALDMFIGFYYRDSGHFPVRWRW